VSASTTSPWLRPSPRQALSPRGNLGPSASAPRQVPSPHGNLPRSAAISTRPHRGRRGKLPPLCRIQTSTHTPASSHPPIMQVQALEHPASQHLEDGSPRHPPQRIPESTPSARPRMSRGAPDFRPQRHPGCARIRREIRGKTLPAILAIPANPSAERLFI
jgi:hypothetical protein